MTNEVGKFLRMCNNFTWLDERGAYCLFPQARLKRNRSKYTRAVFMMACSNDFARKRTIFTPHCALRCYIHIGYYLKVAAKQSQSACCRNLVVRFSRLLFQFWMEIFASPSGPVKGSQRSRPAGEPRSGPQKNPQNFVW